MRTEYVTTDTYAMEARSSDVSEVLLRIRGKFNPFGYETDMKMKTGEREE